MRLRPLAAVSVLALVTACSPHPPSSGTLSTANTDTSAVDCGEQTGPPGRFHLVANSTPAGRPACAEATAVLRQYFRDAPTKAQGTARRLVVNGWTCESDIQSQHAGQVGCDKNGLAFLTRKTRT